MDENDDHQCSKEKSQESERVMRGVEETRFAWHFLNSQRTLRLMLVTME